MAVTWSSQLGKSLRQKIRLAMLFRKEALDLGVLHFGESRRFPLRLLVFVDEASPDTFAEIGSRAKIHSHVPFAQKDFFQPELFAFVYLSKDSLCRRWRTAKITIDCAFNPLVCTAPAT